VQDPTFDRLAEHDVAGPDGKAGPNEVAHQVAQRIEGLALPPELEDLQVPAPEVGLRLNDVGSIKKQLINAGMI
jgi:hypothetical protein